MLNTPEAKVRHKQRILRHVHASHAILASKGVSPPKTHKGLRELLGRNLSKLAYWKRSLEGI
ncbi:hypothetical protein DRO59_05715 [Candidatus Bathyarchaeota archaeon]|nr:MAG: hypothetical protein DRO59_05715 [Candidatus Bathyarchaeota archaeon]